MGSGAVQVGAETAEQHQVRGGKWFHSKVFERRNPTLRAISPPLANQTHVLPLTRNPDHCLVVEHPCQHHSGASPPPQQANRRCPPPRKSRRHCRRPRPYCCPVCPVHGLNRSLQRGIARVCSHPAAGPWTPQGPTIRTVVPAPSQVEFMTR